MVMASKSALVLLTGGADSVTLLAWAVKEGYSCRALYFRTVKQENSELTSAKAAAAQQKVKLDFIDISQPVAALSGDTVIPFGSTIALSMAVSYATRLNIDTILLGFNADDTDAQIVDIKRNYIDKFEAMVKTSRENLQILTPFIEMKKVDVFKLGSKLGVNYSNTWSCNNLQANEHCGKCISCYNRRKGFNLSGIPDQTQYLSEGTDSVGDVCVCLICC